MIIWPAFPCCCHAMLPWCHGMRIWPAFACCCHAIMAKFWGLWVQAVQASVTMTKFRGLWVQAVHASATMAKLWGLRVQAVHATMTSCYENFLLDAHAMLLLYHTIMTSCYNNFLDVSYPLFPKFWISRQKPSGPSEAGIQKLAIRRWSVDHKESMDTPNIVVGALCTKLGAVTKRE